MKSKDQYIQLMDDNKINENTQLDDIKKQLQDFSSDHMESKTLQRLRHEIQLIYLHQLQNESNKHCIKYMQKLIQRKRDQMNAQNNALILQYLKTLQQRHQQMIKQHRVQLQKKNEEIIQLKQQLEKQKEIAAQKINAQKQQPINMKENVQDIQRIVSKMEKDKIKSDQLIYKGKNIKLFWFVMYIIMAFVNSEFVKHIIGGDWRHIAVANIFTSIFFQLVKRTW